jgi:hypothetical protein
MKDVFGLVYASEPQISPDGQRIVNARTFMDIIRIRVSFLAVAAEPVFL